MANRIPQIDSNRRGQYARAYASEIRVHLTHIKHSKVNWHRVLYWEQKLAKVESQS
jgi:hypothetical protein